MQPCMSMKFDKGYCERALTGCTRYRALERGCHATPQIYGSGNSITKTMIAEHDSMEKKIAIIQNHDHKGWVKPNPNSSLPGQPQYVDRLHEIIKQENAAAWRKVRGIVEKQYGSASPAPHVSAQDQDSPVPDAGAFNAAIDPRKKRLGDDNKEHAKFLRSDTDAVLRAVATAEHGVTVHEGAAATQYKFQLKRGALGTIGDERDLGESGEINSNNDKSAAFHVPAETEKKIQQIIDPTRNMRKAIVNDVETKRCTRYKAGVAHFCGRMVDCVQGSLNQKDIQRSNAASKEADAVASTMPQVMKQRAMSAPVAHHVTTKMPAMPKTLKKAIAAPSKPVHMKSMEQQEGGGVFKKQANNPNTELRESRSSSDFPSESEVLHSAANMFGCVLRGGLS